MSTWEGWETGERRWAPSPSVLVRQLLVRAFSEFLASGYKAPGDFTAKEEGG